MVFLRFRQRAPELFRAGYNLYPSPIFQTNLVQKHSETALDTPENEGTKSSFPIKVHAIPGKTPAIYKFCGAKPERKIANP